VPTINNPLKSKMPVIFQLLPLVTSKQLT
jgi:hypothetical protein